MNHVVAEGALTALTYLRSTIFITNPHFSLQNKEEGEMQIYGLLTSHSEIRKETLIDTKKHHDQLGENNKIDTLNLIGYSSYKKKN